MSDEQRKNLLSGTRDWSGDWTYASLWSADGTHDGFTVMSHKRPWGGLHKLAMLTAGQTYTFSACVKVEPGQNHVAMIYITNGDTVNDKIIANSEVDRMSSTFRDVADGGWHIISHTFTPRVSKCAMVRVEATDAYVLSVCAYMLVEGDTPAADAGGGRRYE